MVAVAPAEGAVLAVLPRGPELRADPGAVGERGAKLAAAAVEQLVEGASTRAHREPGPTSSSSSGELGDMLALSYPAAEPREAAEYARGGARRREFGGSASTACERAPCCCPATRWRAWRTCDPRSAPRIPFAWRRR